MRQEVRFCAAPDGTRLAWARHGSGPPLVRVGTWLTHVEFDWGSPVWRHWLEGLGERHTVIRYDERGCGLSDRDIGTVTLEDSVTDLEAVVNASGVDRCAMLGISGGAPVAVAYAARHPERVERLVLYGGWARWSTGLDYARRIAKTLITVISNGWEDPDPAFRRLFTMRFLPEGTPEQMSWFDELQRRSTSGETAAMLYRARSRIDVSELAPLVAADALVLHANGDRVVPFEEGRLLASLLPNASLVPLESVNHVLLPHEPAWKEFLARVHDFLDAPEPPPAGGLADLSKREFDVLRHVAEGLDNDEIASRLSISVRTVERHLSNVYVKLGVTGKAARAAAAARFARQK